MMRTSNPVVHQDVHDLLQAYCTKQQLQFSKKRHVILDRMLQQHDWIDAIELWISLQRTASVSCIYQTLRILVNAGIVEKKNDQDRTMRFRYLTNRAS
jgi:Fe2+ or Zn2+ uptake regulation protein